MSSAEIWVYRTTSGHLFGADLIGFHVEATDGQVGRIDQHSDEVGSAYLVVDTGPWIFGRHVLLPAGTVVQVDHSEKKVYVDRSREEIKAGPDFEPRTHTSPAAREMYSSYYGPFYGGPML
ncbi:hypothetical protein GCM10009665_76000 [Kitasatospora nipponensis]|uniref:PRC-barrel domain protein n=1 Tax=Kitasatospora nipponensis TaxID=258049 RepID=A0ABN1T886_9ACTN